MILGLATLLASSALGWLHFLFFRQAALPLRNLLLVLALTLLPAAMVFAFLLAMATKLLSPAVAGTPLIPRWLALGLGSFIVLVTVARIVIAFVGQPFASIGEAIAALLGAGGVTALCVLAHRQGRT
ncbi:MAG: hypothetical protein ACREO3_02485 [Arenimonas sp.]